MFDPLMGKKGSGWMDPKIAAIMARSLLASTCLAVFLLLVFVTGCSGIIDGNGFVNPNHLSNQEEEEALMEKDNIVSGFNRPEIDLAVPGKLETATLAMG